MTNGLAAAISSYQAGDFETAYQMLEQQLTLGEHLGAQALLVLAQCATKTGRTEKAITCYRQAAQNLPEQAPQLKAFADQLEKKLHAQRQLQRLQAGRLDLRRGMMTPSVQRDYREALRTSLAIDEQRIMDQAMLDRLHRRETDWMTLDRPEHHLAWCDDPTLNEAVSRAGMAGTEDSSGRPAAASTGPVKMAWLGGKEAERDGSRLLLESLLNHLDPALFDFWMIDDGDSLLPEASRHISIAGLEEKDAQAVIAAADFDILLDPAGPASARPRLLSRRLARFHLGLAFYPGPRHGLICDGLLADERVIAPDTEKNYGAPALRLPGCFAPLPPLARHITLRQNLGLPQDRTVLAALLPPERIGPRTADLWADLLHAVPDSMLWIGIAHELARQNFTRWFTEQGLPVERLHISDMPKPGEQAAWLSAADLALDSFPFNSLDQSIAALSSATPLVALKGRTFAGRMTASLLQAAGLDELVAETREDYLQRLVTLAGSAEVRAAMQHKIREQLSGPSAFGGEAFVRALSPMLLEMAGRQTA
ncbi:O-linked N-acetylglucosamine transferase family protein [Rhizobium paknamense]|uniref:protein O-GlcNAc transferase n=1 Tax=Rhizobium paknamense TaxID=1206817 RepID=A0ABU0IGM7_9HYPH|nr:tetratricopeptide repeat protein [Rhizobium paknamense]MDQ0457316.1 tetratricopeptide (TPR) repeat protein [Rhizobium paknamense]